MIYVEQPYSAVTPPVVTTIIFPNPAKTFLKILTPSTSKVSYSIYSASGQKVLAGAVFNNDKINIMALASGVYSIRINQDNEVKTFRFVINP